MAEAGMNRPTPPPLVRAPRRYWLRARPCGNHRAMFYACRTPAVLHRLPWHADSDFPGQ